MTTDAQKLFDSGCMGYKSASWVVYNWRDADVEIIKNALTQAEKAEGLVKAMTKIQTISAHMKSDRAGELNKIASDALKPFQEDFL